MSFSVAGSGKFQTTDSVCLAFTHADSNVFIECQSYTSDGASNAGLYVEDADVTIVAHDTCASLDYDGIWHAGAGTVRVKAPRITGGDNAIETGVSITGTLSIDVPELESSSTVLNLNGGTVVWNGYSAIDPTPSAVNPTVRVDNTIINDVFTLGFKCEYRLSSENKKPAIAGFYG